MDTLTLIGALLFFVGLLIFSLKLIYYNKRRFDDDVETQGPIQSSLTPRGVIRGLALAIFLIALLILVLAS